MPRRTAPQRKTANCCLRASAMRGTLSARLIVAKERIPSVDNKLVLFKTTVSSKQTYT